MKRHVVRDMLFGIGAMILLAGTTIAAEVPEKRPRPDGKSADMTRPVQVYILLGQSNMLGFGKITGDHGLEWRDGKIYIASPPSQMIHVVEAETWTEVHRFRAPGLRVHGLAWGARGRLWSADTSAGTVRLLDPAEGRIYDVFRVEAPDEVHGMTIHQGTFWYCHAETRDIGCLIRD